jgi:tetratricopeptide (TPR) repeat protein
MGQRDRTIDLATALNDRGSSLRAQGKLSDAVLDLDQAVELCTSLVEKHGRTGATISLAMSLNNRANVLGDLGKLADALDDYDKAIALYTRLIDEEGRKDLTSQLVTGLNNRGIVLLQQGKTQQAVQELEKAVDLCNSLGAQEPDTDVANGLAVGLTVLAKVYGTSNAARFHDSAKAIEYATRACELTNHQNADLLDTLATVYAATRDFHAAYRWLAKSVQLGPDDPKSERATRLEYYRQMKSRMRAD